MLLTCASYDFGPTAIRFPRGVVVGVDMNQCEDLVPIGKGRVLRTGADSAIIAIGTMVRPCMEAAENLARAGIATAVLDARFLKPLDVEAVTSLARGVGAVFTVEENSAIGGLGDAVARCLTVERIATPVHRIGVPDLFVPHGERYSLLDEIGLSASRIAETIRGNFTGYRNGDDGGCR
jgi:1-deoxy-D-xylulose-5-phosphate synthase